MSKSEKSIDILELIVFFYQKRKRLLFLLVIGVILSVVYSLLMEKEYQAEITFIPQTASTESSPLGQFSGIANFAGISLGQQASPEITPALYPNLLENYEVLDRILKTQILPDGIEDSVSLRYYYDSLYTPSPLGNIAKYTIGLPRTIINGLRGKDEPQEAHDSTQGGYRRITFSEHGLFGLLKSQINIIPNERSGVVTVAVKMPDPVLAAQVASKVMDILKDELVNFKVEKAKQEYEYVELLFQEKEKEYTERQRDLVAYKDKNIGLRTASSQIRQQNLQSQYDLSFSVYSSVAQRLEDAKIKLQRETPILTIIKPVVIPLHAELSKTKVVMVAFILIVFILVLSTILIHYLTPFVKQLKSKV